MNPILRRGITRLAALVLCLVLVACSPTTFDEGETFSGGARRAALQVGLTAPDFTLKTLDTLDGRAVTLSALRGKRVLLNFWASLCGPCKKEMPDFNAAYAELKGQAVEFVCIGTQDNQDNLRQFLRETPVVYPIVEDADGRIADTYAVLGLPATVFVDSKGVIQRIHAGPLTKADVWQTLAALE